MATGSVDLGDANLFYEIVSKETVATVDEIATKLPEDKAEQQPESGKVARTTGARGTPYRIEIPEMIEGCVVTEIAKKAFLSCRGLREIIVPDGVTEIGEWAFAYSKHLEVVSLPAKEISFGKDLFLGCESLEKIIFRDSDASQSANSVPYLTAKAVIVLDSPFLCNPLEAGSEEWFRQLDERILSFLEKDDMDGYAELWTCGEEDYDGKDYDPYSYPKEKRKDKVRMLFFRLFHQDGLKQENREKYYEYLRAHTAGCENQETWEVLSEECGNKHEYYEIFAEAGCLQNENFNRIMDDLGELSERDMTKNYPEMKGYFIRYRQENQKESQDDFFDMFTL